MQSKEVIQDLKTALLKVSGVLSDVSFTYSAQFTSETDKEHRDILRKSVKERIFHEAYIQTYKNMVPYASIFLDWEGSEKEWCSLNDSEFTFSIFKPERTFYQGWLLMLPLEAENATNKGLFFTTQAQEPYLCLLKIENLYLYFNSVRFRPIN